MTRLLLCLDVDSTICKIEFLDEFAKHLGKYEEITTLTNSAMDGDISFDNSFKLLHGRHNAKLESKINSN